jgi:hypothetical protein
MLASINLQIVPASFPIILELMLDSGHDFLKASNNGVHPSGAQEHMSFSLVTVYDIGPTNIVHWNGTVRN